MWNFIDLMRINFFNFFSFSNQIIVALKHMVHCIRTSEIGTNYIAGSVYFRENKPQFEDVFVMMGFIFYKNVKGNWC